MISLKHVCKVFNGIAAVDGISLTVAEGETFVLLGTSGCGKTTTLKMINRLVLPTEGAIFVDEKNIATQAPEQLRRHIGYVLQRNSLFPHYTVYENIAVVPRLLKWDKDRTAKRIDQLMEQLRLPAHYLSVYPHQLSGGEAQRVNLARALVADPPVLLMDEPFSALDTLTRSAIRKDFGALEELKKKTILMVTHDVQEAFELGDRICLMDKGRIMQTGKPAELLFEPANDFVRDFLSDAYTQLAFAVITLGEIWPYLDDQNEASETSATFTSKHTIAHALSGLEDKNNRKAAISIRHDESGEQKHTTWEGLLAALSHYQKNR